ADPVEDAPAPAELHGADADEVHLRLLDGAVGLLDQRARHAAPAKLARERQADRPAADNQNGRARAHLYLRSISWNDWMSTRRWRSAKPASMPVVSPIRPFWFRCFRARCMPNTAACSAVLA